MMLKSLFAVTALAVPLAIAAAPTPAEAGPRDGYRCHMVKKSVYKFGKRKTRWVRVCKPRKHVHFRAYNKRRW